MIAYKKSARLGEGGGQKLGGGVGGEFRIKLVSWVYSCDEEYRKST